MLVGTETIVDRLDGILMALSNVERRSWAVKFQNMVD